jgi:hypothetical protein
MSTPLGQIISQAPRLAPDPDVSGGTTFLFDFRSSGAISSNFAVGDTPVILAAFNIADDDEVFVERVVFDGRGGMHTQIVTVEGLQLMLTSDDTELVLDRAGLYRVTVSESAVGDIVVLAIQNTVPSGIISQAR